MQPESIIKRGNQCVLHALTAPRRRGRPHARAGEDRAQRSEKRQGFRPLHCRSVYGSRLQVREPSHSGTRSRTLSPPTPVRIKGHYLLSFLPAFLSPDSKCLGSVSNTCLSASPFLPKRFIFFCAFFIVVLVFLAILASRTPERSREVREQLRLREMGVGGTESSRFLFLVTLRDSLAWTAQWAFSSPPTATPGPRVSSSEAFR